jgi:CBS domain containing-hemolysin-like protein
VAAFFSAAETAFLSVNQFRIRGRVEGKGRSSKTLEQILKHPQWLLTTLLLGKTFSIVSLAALTYFLLLDKVPYSLLFSILLVSFFFLVFGEIIPKSLISARVEEFALYSAGFLRGLAWLCRPLVAFILLFTTPLIRFLGGQEAIAVPRLTEEEISAMIEIGQEEGIFEKEETDLVQSALAFDDTPVSNILTPRVDIVAIPEDCSVPDALKTISEQGYSRIPVYRETVDDIIGILCAKDLLIALSRSEPFELRYWLRPAYFVPQNKRLHDLLREMQSQEIQMAIVNDEYGGTAGLVTVEDILEQIVGEIRDEYDEEPVDIRMLDEKTALVNSRTAINQVNEALGISLPLDGYQTIGGLVISSLGRVAKVGDVVETEDARITVKAIKGIRIQQVLMEFCPPRPVEEIS